MKTLFNFLKPKPIILQVNDKLSYFQPLAPLSSRRCQPMLQLIFISYQSPAQPSMHRIPGSLNGPNKAIAKHLEIFRSDTENNPRPAHGSFSVELWHDTLCVLYSLCEEYSWSFQGACSLQKKIQVNQFNLMASEMISLNRSLQDVRLSACKNKVTLGDLSVFNNLCKLFRLSFCNLRFTRACCRPPQ